MPTSSPMAHPAAQRRVDASHCPVRACSGRAGLTDGHGDLLDGAYLVGRAPVIEPPTVHVMAGVPAGADLQQYRDFTHLYLAAPTAYLTPESSYILLRHQGRILYAKPVLYAYYNERRRRTDDDNYRRQTGSAYMRRGHVVGVGPAVPIRRAFRWIDARYANGLTLGGLHDPREGEPFHWQTAMVVRTTDGRRVARSPFTVIRTKDLQVPSQSSRAERALSDSLRRAGIEVCPHLQAIRLPAGWARPDITIPHLRTIVEFDGSYWHRGAANQDRDLLKTRAFLAAGWRVIRVREPGLDLLPSRTRGLRQIAMAPRETHDHLVARVIGALA